MGLKPLFDRVLVKREEAPETTEGGIYVPQNVQQESQRATVVAVGPGRTLDSGSVVPCAVKNGDTVLLQKFGGTEIEIEGVTHLIVSEGDILGVVES